MLIKSFHSVSTLDQEVPTKVNKNKGFTRKKYLIGGAQDNLVNKKTCPSKIKTKVTKSIQLIITPQILLPANVKTT